MRISDKLYAFLSRFGGLLVLLSVLATCWVVVFNRDKEIDMVEANRQYSELMMRRQKMEAVLRDFIGIAGNDAGVLQILAKHKIVTVQQQPAAQPQPGGAPTR